MSNMRQKASQWNVT